MEAPIEETLDRGIEARHEGLSEVVVEVVPRIAEVVAGEATTMPIHLRRRMLLLPHQQAQLLLLERRNDSCAKRLATSGYISPG